MSISQFTIVLKVLISYYMHRVQYQTISATALFLALRMYSHFLKKINLKCLASF